MKIYGKDTLNFSLLISSLSTFPSSYITLSHSPYTLKLYAKEVFIRALCQMLGCLPYESCLVPIIFMVGAILFAQK